MKYNLIVIGGGPAGMMAAGRAAERGASVLLLEKNARLGRKLLITGKGRCNISHHEFNNRDLISVFGENSDFLFSSFSKFSVPETLFFFNNRGLETKVERGNRIFPLSDNSEDVLDVLINYMKEGYVKIQTKAEVTDILYKKNKIEKIIVNNHEELIADNYLIATGGLSYPGTGSTGDGYDWAENMGHEIIDPAPALVGIITAERWIKELQGLSLKNVEISIWQNDKKVDSRFGEALFTHEGLSGPIILDMSKEIGKSLKKGLLKLKIDFKPALDYPTLDKRLIKDFKANSNKEFRNSLGKLLPQKLIPIIISMSNIDSYKKVNGITKEERKTLLHLLKEFTLNIERIDGFNRAVITCGGVDLHDIDPKTLKSKLVDDLYFAGEVLDLDAPTGGYNLQLAWTSGWVVGDSIEF